MTTSGGLIELFTSGAGLTFGLGVGVGLLAPALMARRRKANKLLVTPPPHPNWAPGQKMLSPHGTASVEVDPSTVGGIYPLVISSVVPRPIAFISTVDAKGIRNLSPYSYFNILSHDPPIVAMGHCHGRTGKKDSLRNIEETGEFVVCIISEWFIEAANHTCGPYDPDVDEFELAGLTPLASKTVRAPRVGESAVNMECKVVHKYEVQGKDGKPSTTIVLGEVKMYHIAEALYEPNGGGEGKPTVKLDGFQPMSRFGGNTYGRVTSTFDMLRPPKSAQDVLKKDK